MNQQYYDVVFLLPGRQFHQTFLSSWTNTIAFLHNNNISYTWVILYNAIVSDTRNLLMAHDFNTNEFVLDVAKHRQVSLFSDSVVCQKVIMIDDDMVWTPEDIQKLIESPYDVTVGIYKLSNNINISIAEKDEKTFLKPEDLGDRKEPFPILTAGLGFTACTYDVLSQIQPPWFGLSLKHGEGSFESKGEDFFFFEKLREVGASIYADPTIKLGHMKFSQWRV